VFFAIWWAWMNFHVVRVGGHTDDVPYRLLTTVQMGGVLVLARVCRRMTATTIGR